MSTVPLVINTLDATISSQDIDSGEEFISKKINSPVQGRTGQYTQKFKTLAAGFDTQLPMSVGGTGANGGSQIYIKNSDKNAVLTVKWTIGAGVVSFIQLQPGGFIILWQPSAATTVGTVPGTVSVASSVGGTYCEIFQGVIKD